MIVLCYLRIWKGMPLCDIVGIYENYDAAMEGIAFDSVLADEELLRIYGQPTLREEVVRQNDTKRYYFTNWGDIKRWFIMIPV